MGWLDDERRGIDIARYEARRMVSRALRKKWLVLGLAVALTGVVIFRESRKRASYSASVTFRIDENVSEETGQAARPASQLREYIIDTVLSHPRCQEIIKKFKLYPAEMRRNPRLATAQLYDDMEINIFRNYFLEQERTARSALLQVKYVAKDPEIAYSVVQAIAFMIKEHQLAEGRERAEALTRWADQAVAAARTKWERLRHQHSQTLVAFNKAKNSEERALLAAEAALGADSVSMALWDLQRAEQIKATGALRLSLESKQMGLSFVLVDFEKPRFAPPRARRLIMLAGIIFSVLLPLVVMVFGAFLPYLYNAQDIRRLGLHAVGHVPAFAGWQEGTLRARLEGQRWALGTQAPPGAAVSPSASPSP